MWPPWYEVTATACTSSSMAASTISRAERLWPRWITSAPDAWRMRRKMLIDASWPSNSEVAVTKRILWAVWGPSAPVRSVIPLSLYRRFSPVALTPTPPRRVHGPDNVHIHGASAGSAARAEHGDDRNLRRSVPGRDGEVAVGLVAHD